MIRVIEGDALAEMRRFDDGAFDMALVDLPYGATQNEWDKRIPFEPMWRELTRVCGGAMVFTAIQPFASELVVNAAHLFKHEWIWSKNKGSGHLNCNKAPLRYHEHVLVFSQNGYVYNPQMTNGHEPGHFARQAQASKNYGAQKQATYGGSTSRYPRSTIEFPVMNNDDPKRVHPTQKPVELFRYLIRTYSDPTDHILDFCAGAGTTGVAARAEGRHATLIDSHPTFAAHMRRVFQTQWLA